MKNIMVTWNKSLLIAVMIIAINPILAIYAADELIGMWNFDEGTGSTAYDETGYENNGTLYGTPSWTTGIDGDAISFDGTDDYVDCGNDSIFNFNGTNAFTISCWIKPENLAAKQGIVGKWGGTVTGNWYESPYMIAFDDYGKVRIAIGSETETGSVYIMADNFTVSKWYHIVATYDGYTLCAYLNGQKKDSAYYNFPLASNTQSLKIGVYGNSTLYYFDGSIDCVSLYNYSFNANEVMELYISAGICGEWNLNEGSGSTAADDSGYDNDGVIYGANWTNGHPDSDGYFRNALSFDGTDDYVDCGNDSMFNFNDTNAFTISCWIKPENLAAKQGIVGKWGGTVTGNWYESPYMIAFDDYGKVRIAIGADVSTGSIYIPASNFTSGNWYHIAATYDGSVLRGYLNGVEKDSEQYDFTLVSNSSSVEIGRYGNSTKYCFDGDIDKVRLYNRALDQDAVQTVYSNLVSAYADKTYYTTENAEVISEINMPSTELDDCYLVAKNSAGTTLDTNNTPETDTELVINNANLSTGDNTITVELHKDTGELLYKYDTEVIKLASNSGFETKIDRKNGIILRDGNKFFPMGFYMYNILSDDTSDFQEVAQADFNSIIRWKSYGVAATDATTYLENADDYDLLVVDRPSAYSSVKLRLYRGDAEDFWDAYIDELNNILAGVGYAKLETNLLGYYSLDEPVATQLTALEDLYENINQEDGYHPVYIFMDPKEIAPYEQSDIIGQSGYWHPPFESGEERSSINYVTESVCEGSIRRNNNHKGFCFVLMGEFYSASRKRSITADEQRCQTYLALIHGAKGIFYFRYPVYHDGMWSELASLADEVDDLSPSLLMPDLEQSISYYEESSPVDFNPETGDFVDVPIRLFEAPANAGYDYLLLVTNTREYSVDVDYSISILGSNTVSRLFNAGTFSPSDGEFSDTLAAYATRAYTFNSASTDPVTISVDYDPGTPPDAETVHPDSGRSGYTNLMQNPSLEDNTVTNWPDYCWPYYANPRINTANQQWGLVTDSPYHGSKCLKIADGDGETLGEINGAYFYLTPQHADTNGKDYTFSVYLKANESGKTVRIGNNLGYSIITVTDSWARYTLTFNVPAYWSANNVFYIQLWDTGAIYVDAIQVEQASSATDFTTD